MSGFIPFSSIPVPKKGRTNFNLSHSVSGTFPLSKLCPVFFADTIPGNSYKINVYNLTKLETLIAPAMQRVDASLLWFKLPKRLVFRHFKKWYSGGEDGQDAHQKPHINLYEFGAYLVAHYNYSSQYLLDLTEALFGPGSLWNYLGLPCPLEYDTQTHVWKVISVENWANITASDSDFIDVMPLIAYHYIYDTMFRDQTLSEPMFTDAEEGVFVINPQIYKFEFYGSNGVKHTLTSIPTGADLSEGGTIDPKDMIHLLKLHNRCWKKDYFTSALPSAQRGPEVSMSLTGNAEVHIPSQLASLGATSSSTRQIKFVTEHPLGQGSLPANLIDDGGADNVHTLGASLTNEVQSVNGTLSSLEGYANLSNLSPISIVAFRNLFKLQQFLEKNNVSGGRYIESILAHWAERVPDFTVQRPQHVRSTSLPVQISEVTATANSQGVNSLVGDQAGRARTQGNLGSVRIYTQEPSFIFALYCVGAPPSYAGQGIPRIFQHITRFDEPWTEFQHIGEQAIKVRELYVDFKEGSEMDEDFGYQQRYSEYKYIPDRVVGDFQTSLSYWHMARMFSDIPALNEDFVTQYLDPRIFAVNIANGRPVTADFFFDVQCKQKLSKYSTPKLT